METAINNLNWMAFNLFLAVLGVLFGWLYYYSKKKVFSIAFFILWILFLPNTIYLITDLQHIYKQWSNPYLEVQLTLIVQYFLIALLGITTYLMAMYPIDKVFTNLHLKRKPKVKLTLLITINIFTAFALILGKFQRTHSWYVFTDFLRVLSDIKEVVTNPILFSLVLFFAFVINLTYFAFKKVIPISARIKK